MLNKYQKKVVYCKDIKPLLVEAGPGSGKTFVIIERIKYLLKNADPETFLVMTFSRKAAKQLKDRLYDELPREVVDKMQISTIHTFCQDFLNENGICVSLLDDDDSERKELFLKKHIKYLGFVDEFTPNNYKSIISKYKEFTVFNVDSNKLVDYIYKNKPYSEEYVNFVHSLDWFKRKVVKKKFNNDWYNARYLQVAHSYPKYLELLDKYAYVDYDTVQKKALELLNTDCKNKFKNILIDEFQDTDPIQARIFKKLLESSDTFTAVGDIDQRIYFFRGAYGDYFEEFSKEYDVDVYPLNINHRSSNEIIKVSDEFIKDKRGGYSNKKLEPYWNIHNNSYILKNESYEEEALNIFNFIKYLDENDIIDDYNDIAILTKSVLYSDTMSNLINCLNKQSIPVNVTDFNDLCNKNEIKSIITLLYYITRRPDDTYTHEVEKDWGGLKAFNGEEFTPTMWSLADSTKNYLSELEDNFRENVKNCEVPVLKKLKRRGFTSDSLKNMFENDNRDEDFFNLLFQHVKRHEVDLTKITDEKDREFFSKLHETSQLLKVEENKPTILEIYYQLLELGGYFKEECINDDDNSLALENLARLTKTIENYENQYSKYDVKGLLYFLTRTIEQYSSSEVHDDGINIMTVHKAKGLEFPVTIVASLEKDKFPSIPKDPNRKNKWNMYEETFYTPNYCLRYKNTTEDEDNELESLEGVRVTYVAMTRARDILLLSSVGDIPPEIEKLSPYLKEFDINNLENNKMRKVKENEDKNDKLELSYSSFDTYKTCPLKYKLIYKFEFKTSSHDEVTLGSLIHRCLEAVNHKLKLSNEISDEEVINIAKKIYSTQFNIDESPNDFNDFCDNIFDYLEEFLDNDFEVIDCEVPFSIEFDDFILIGKIDLIYKDGNKIKVLDYKNTEFRQSNMSKYKSQLLTYILALENDYRYREYNINTKQASIYLLQSNKFLPLNIDDDEDISNQLKEMKNVSLSIENNYFDSNKSENCNICEFKEYCESGKNG